MIERMFPSALGELRDTVATAACAFEPRSLSLDAAVTTLREWTAIANAAVAVCSLVAARVDELGPPASSGASDASDFIAKATGTTAAKANQRIKTGKRMRRAAKTRAKAMDGSLSPDQADAIVDAVDADPAAEDTLLDTAERSSLSELRDECARRKAAADPDPDATRARIHANRRLRRYRDVEGAEHLHAVGTKDQLARVDQALKPFIDTAFETARRDGTRESFEAYAFDSLVAMADASRHGSAGATANAQRNPRYLAVLRIDHQALVRGAVAADETCEIAGLGPIPVTTARDLLGDATLKLVITRGVDVRNVTNLGRGATAAQRIALLWEKPTCSREGCGRRARLEIDHRDEWRTVHRTDLDNLEPLCHHDHHLKTTKGWALIPGTGVRPMVPPHHPDHPRSQPATGPPLPTPVG
ncbi:MAG: DUF222 domain-containing protein [Acidimicrobiales bacterium]